MTDPDLKELLDPVIQIAYEAGKEIMEIYEAGFSVAEKSDHTPVTEADMAAHQVIVNRLNELTPHLPILTEESTAMAFKLRQSWPRYWLIDPLDGTREFIKRNGEFTVNIALIDGHQSVMGVVYAPVEGVIYYAAKSQGAFKQDSTERPVAIRVREKCRDKVLIACGRSEPSTDFKNFVSKLEDYEVIYVGSALKSCLVAEGKADLYARLGPTSEWDTAAAQCVVEEAGGKITDTSMQSIQYNTKDNLLNPHFFVYGDLSIDWSEFL